MWIQHDGMSRPIAEELVAAGIPKESVVLDFHPPGVRRYASVATEQSIRERAKQVMLNTEQLLSRITIEPNIMLGKPTIRGMRITVEQILKALSGGVSEKELLEDYPELEKEDFLAIFAYVSVLVEEEQVFPVRIFA